MIDNSKGDQASLLDKPGASNNGPDR